MFELVTMFFTAGGSAALGSVLKGVFGAISDSRQQKFELELAREARGNEFALKFQEQLNSGEGGMFTRLHAGCSRSYYAEPSRQSSSFAPSSQVQKSSPLQTQQEKEQPKSFSDSSHFLLQSPIMVTTGSLASYFVIVLAPMVLGFYFTPGGRR